MAAGDNYKKAGVNIDAGEEAVGRIKKLARSTLRPEVLEGVGGFGGLFAPHLSGLHEPVLVAGCDGVGTKLKLAFATGRHDTVGIDCVAMCVNDILVQGAEPLFFLDYLAVGRLEPAQVEEIVKGLVAGCKLAGCALLGGETAEMPGFYRVGEYDLAGFAVGLVDRKRVVDGSAISENDALIGLESSGLHSNGYSLARKVLLETASLKLADDQPLLKMSLADELLKPTIIYVKPVLQALEHFKIKGMAHITGGGLSDNLPRILPTGLAAEVDVQSWPVPPIFKMIADLGAINREEMYRVFNMGIGYVLVVPPAAVNGMIEHFSSYGLKAYRIGKISKGQRKVCYR